MSPLKGVTQEPALKELWKNLEKEQIQTLRKAIESRGEHQTSCIVHLPDTKNVFYDKLYTILDPVFIVKLFGKYLTVFVIMHNRAVTKEKTLF